MPFAQGIGVVAIVRSDVTLAAATVEGTLTRFTTLPEAIHLASHGFLGAAEGKPITVDGGRRTTTLAGAIT